MTIKLTTEESDLIEGLSRFPHLLDELKVANMLHKLANRLRAPENASLTPKRLLPTDPHLQAIPYNPFRENKLAGYWSNAVSNMTEPEVAVPYQEHFSRQDLEQLLEDKGLS